MAAFGVSSHPVAAIAAGEVAGQLLDAGARHSDLVIAAVTPGYAGALADLAEVWCRVLEPTVLLAATVSSLTLVSGSAAVAPTGSAPGVTGDGMALAAGELGPLTGRVLDAGGLPEPGPPPFPPAGSFVLGAPGALRGLLATGGAGVLGGAAAGPVAVGGALGPDGGRRVAGRGGAVVAYLGARPASASTSALRPLGSPVRADDTDGAVLARLDGSPAFDLLVELTRDGVAADDLPGLGAGLHVERLGDDGRPEGPPIPVVGRQAGGSGLALAAAVPTGSRLRFLVRDAASLRRAVTAVLDATVGGGGRADGAVVLAPPGTGELLGDAPLPTVPPAGLLCLELAQQVATGVGGSGGPGLRRAGVGCLAMSGPWS